MNLFAVENNEVKPIAMVKSPKPFERVIEECKGWHQYKKLYAETKDDRYRKMAFDEFKHMLAAMQDAITEIRECASTDECAEMTTFLNIIGKA